MNRKLLKVLKYLAILGGGFFLASWVFNHINAWVGLLVALIVLGYGINSALED